MPQEDPPLCPLCNEPTKVKPEDGYWKPWAIACWDCLLTLEGRPGESLERLTAKWNELLAMSKEGST